MVRAWSLRSCFFLCQQTLFDIVSLHQVYKWVPEIIMLGGGGGVGEGDLAYG